MTEGPPSRDGRGAEPLLRVERLSVQFPSPLGPIAAVDSVDLTLAAGETLALVGESGCGKSTLARALVGLVAPRAGRVRLGGEDVLGRSRGELRRLRSRVQLVFQDPYASLNPRLTIAATLSEALLLHGHAQARDADARVCALLGQVGLDPEQRRRYPHEFSGGQRQRISIARALAVEPEILLCDEVTSALDVSVQAQILELLRELQRTLGIAYLFITHDLGVVRSIATRVAVMYLGRIVELRETEAFFEHPAHPYSQGLLASIPALRAARGAPRSLMRGEIPSAAHPPPGCHFHTRCPRVFDRCRREPPSLYPVEHGESRCFLSEPSDLAPR